MGVSNQLLLTLITFLISTTAAQAQFTGCFTDPGCATLIVGGLSSNAEDCCVNNNEGLYYNDGGQCFQCIVYGWSSDNFTRPEAQFSYDVPFAYFKGPSNAQLRMAIDYNGEGTASEEEFGMGQNVVSLPLNPRGTTSITFQADRVALEPDETFVLELALLNVANVNRALFASSLPNVFFRSRQEFIIQDSTALVFRLREINRFVDESNRFIPVVVTVANEVELASDISLVLTPMIAPEDFTPLPTTRPFARANTIPDRIDFFTEPIILHFTAGGTTVLAGDVLIYDDLIDEALEYFVVTLTFQDPDNVPPLASIESNGGDIIRIDIIDNDDIFIGFALPNTTYPEIEADYIIQIIKGAGNVTEKTISFVLNLFSTAPNGLVGNADPSADGEDNDFFFPLLTILSILPEENYTFATDLTIYDDELPEVTEAAQLRLSLPTDGMFPRFKTLPQYPSFFIIIEDDDRFRIGFEQTSYTVNEFLGMLEVCVRMFEPRDDTSLGSLTVSIGVETVEGSADGSDYTERTGARNAFLIFFTDDFRQNCINVQITQDSLFEVEEQFSLRFIALEGTSLPDNIVLNPPMSTIQITNGRFGGCYSNSSCSGDSLGPSNAEDCCVSSAGTYFSDETTCFQCIVYGWSTDNFPASEAQSPYSIPLVYSKGPAAQIVFTVIDTSKGTATQNVDYIQNQQVVTLSLNAGATLSVTFLIDTIAFEPDETFVLELSVTSITPAASVQLLNASLLNVFFQSRQNFIIQDSTDPPQTQLPGCFTDPGCATFVVGGPSSNAEDCCVNNNAGLYYSDGGQCFQCIVYGFGLDTFTRPEAQFPYDFPFAYFKGPSNAQLRMAIDYNGEGTALPGEFGISQSVVSLPLNPGGTTSITFQADRVALEPDETFVLELVLLNVANANQAFFDQSLPNVFFRSRQEFIIQESTAIIFRLREINRFVDESNRFIPVVVTVANEVELASDISLVLTPMIAPEDFRPLPTTRPFARANTNEGRIDFFTAPITLNFTAGGEIVLAGDVLIYDDLIDEALEYFVISLTFQDPDNVPPLASIESNGGDIIRIDIVDNDDIFIGFALPNTTYPEVEFDYQIQIIKGAGNVTEQIISFVVNLFQTAPEGLGNAIPSSNIEDNDFSFPPSTLLSIFPEQNDTVSPDLTIFPDNLPEVTEAAQLRLSLPTDGTFPRFKTLPQYPSFFIIIEDNDIFRIGFENTSYTVNEGIGFLEVCVRMFEPPEESLIGRLTVDLGVETVQGTADGDDYTEVTGARFAYFLFFSDTSRRSCFIVEITEDNRYEFEEQFSLRFIELEGTTLPSILVLDPARSNITIVDNEDVTVGFINPPYSAREDEGPMIFTVGLTSDHILDRDIELSFSTADGLIADFAAMAGLDYTSIINMPIILSVGMQTIQIAVELINDPIFENNEMFQGTLTIISGERVSLSPGTANATIIEDEVVCQELELLVNGRIEYSPDTTAPYLEGTNAEHICFPGFFLIGNVIRVCQSDSTFSETSPTCQPIQCNPLDDIENGLITYAPDVTPNYDLGTVAFYTCNAGFVLDISLGSTFRTCVDDDGLDAIGVFDNQAPRCVPIECRVLPVFANGMIVYATDVIANFELGTTATYSCNEGYTLDLSIGVEVRTCIDGGDNNAVGVFSDQEPACVRIQCTPLSGIPNGRIEYGPDTTANYMLGTTATYICNDVFFLDLSAGNEVRTCEDDNGLNDLGEFTGSQPTCVLIECLPLLAITNGVITYAPDIIPNYDLGTEATYACDAGFVLDLSLGGSEMRTCFDDLDNNAEGVFSGQAPACILSGPQCPLGTYVEQLSSGVPSCVTCPANSNSVETNSPECTCFNGYHRTNLEGPNTPCTSPPSACRNIELVQQRTRRNSITVRWERPEITGRDDFYYNIFHSEDNQTFTQHNRRPYVKQDALVDYSVSGLQPLTTYTIRVISENGVSGQEEGGQSRSCEVVAMTGDTRSEAPSRVLGHCSIIVWTTPRRSYGRVTGYDVNFVNPGSDNVIVAKGNRELFHVIGDEVSVSNQERVMVQVRAKTAAADGRWSTLVPLGCN